MRPTIWLMALAIVGAFAAPVRAADPVITIDGSSSLYPLTEVVAREFQIGARDAPQIVAEVSGTTGGLRSFCAGKIDIANASRPISADEIEACRRARVRFVELPVALDAIAVIVHPGNRIVDALTVEELRRLWLAGPAPVRTWSELREGLPERPLRLYGPDADSGTADYFEAVVIGPAGTMRTDHNASDDDYRIVRQVAGDADGLAFVGFAYAEPARGRVRILPISPQAGTPAVAPTSTSMLDGSYRPLTRPLFLYVSRDALKRRSVRNFAAYYLERAPVLAKEAGLVPLPLDLYQLADRRLEKQVTGSVFHGRAPESIDLGTLRTLEGD